MTSSDADVPKYGLQTKFRNQTMQDLVKIALVLSREGLKSRQKFNGHGELETVFLDDLDHMAKTGQSNADVLIAKYGNEWGGDITKAYEDCSF